MKKKYKNLVFDFGGVLVDLDQNRCLTSFEKLGFDAAPFIGRYAQQGVFKELEKGLVSAHEFCEGIRRDTKMPELSDEQLSNAWNAFLVGIPHERLELLLKLRENHRLFILSNTNIIHWELTCRGFFKYKGYDIQDYFEKVFLSFELHEVKPDPEIFKSMLSIACIRPEETLFIDDSQENCRQANLLGIDTHWADPGRNWMDMFIDIAK